MFFADPSLLLYQCDNEYERKNLDKYETSAVDLITFIVQECAALRVCTVKSEILSFIKFR